MIPSLIAMARQFGVSPIFALLVLAAISTGLVLFVQSVAGWFEEQIP